MWERSKLEESKYFWECQIGINEKEKITDSSQKGSNDQWKQLTGKEA